MKRRPTAYLFLFALMGSFLGTNLPASYQPFLMLTCLCIIVLVFVPRDILRILCLLLFTFLTCALSASLLKEKYDSIIASIPNTEVNYDGVIENTWLKTDGSLRALVKIHGIDQKSCPPFRILLKLFDSASVLQIWAGQNIKFKAQATPLPVALSDIHFDGYRFGLSKNVHATANILEHQRIYIDENQKKFLLGKMRSSIWRSLGAELTPRESALLLALMIGQTDFFDDEQKEIFANIGAQHLLAVSGFQVTIIALICFVIFGSLAPFLLPFTLCHRSKLLAALLTLIAIWAYVFLCNCPKSAVRAALMTSIMLSTHVLAKRLDLLDALFLSGFLFILYDPLAPIDLGFLLSYSALFGILLAHFRSANLRSWFKQKSLVAYWALTLLISSTAAFLATLPIIAVYFLAVPPLSIIANFVLGPVAAILQAPAIILGMLGTIFSNQAMILIAAKCSMIIEIIAEFLFSILGENLFYFTWSHKTIFICCCSIFMLFLVLLRKNNILLILGLCGLCLPVLENIFAAKNSLHITLIPVGQGDSTLLAMPNGQHMLIDAGGSMQKKFDPGLKIVLPTLKRKGVKKLDVLAITHPDPDHILGAFALLENIKIDEIWIGGFDPNHPLAKIFLAKAAQKNILVKTPRDLLGSNLFGQTEIQVLAPNTQKTSDIFYELSSNDNSLVLRILYQGQTMLWPGDLEIFGEKLLLSDSLDISAKILKAPHHGSKTSSSPDFIKMVSPEYVLYSTGVNNQFGFPHNEVKERYEQKNIKAFDTAKHGQIDIRVAENKIYFSTFRIGL